jgi:hypothetical protein
MQQRFVSAAATAAVLPTADTQTALETVKAFHPQQPVRGPIFNPQGAVIVHQAMKHMSLSVSQSLSFLCSFQSMF